MAGCESGLSCDDLSKQRANAPRHRETEVCTYATERLTVRGSGKAAGVWSFLTSASVYVDHPYTTPLAHTLNVDLFAESALPARQIALELSLESAEALVAAISRAVETARQTTNR
jgi:hypothetical protein